MGTPGNSTHNFLFRPSKTYQAQETGGKTPLGPLELCLRHPGVWKKNRTSGRGLGVLSSTAWLQASEGTPVHHLTPLALSGSPLSLPLPGSRRPIPSPMTSVSLLPLSRHSLPFSLSKLCFLF